MKNYLFNNANTLNDCTALLYEAMYEQSQMELKILEAMVNADTLQAKYRASGMYTESTIQAFNEEAFEKIKSFIIKIIENAITQIKEWWNKLKSFALRKLDIIRDWLKNRKIGKPKQDAKPETSSNTSTSNTSNSAKASYSAVQKAFAAVPEPKPNPAQPKQEPKSEPKNDFDIGELSIEWCNFDESIDKFIELYDEAANINDLDDMKNIFKEISKEADDKFKNHNSSAHNTYIMETLRARGLLYTTEERSEIAKIFEEKEMKVKEIPELENGNGVTKIETQTRNRITQVDSIINKAIKSYENLKSKVNTTFTTSSEQFAAMYYIREVIGELRGLNKLLNNALNSRLKALANLTSRITSHKNGISESMTNLIAETAMYEIIMAPVYNDYDLCSAEGIKRFAAAKLEAAMDDISDVIDNAIGSNNAQDIESFSFSW